MMHENNGSPSSLREVSDNNSISQSQLLLQIDKLKRENKQLKNDAAKQNEKDYSKVNELQTEIGNAL